MRNLRFCSTMATALAVEMPRRRRIFCSSFLIAAVVVAVGAIASSRAVSQRDLPNQLVAATPTPTPCSAWVELTPVPYDAGEVFAASDGAYVYAGGGRSDTTTFHNDLLRYNPVNNSWMPLASSPDQHYASQAVYFNGKIYNMGGFVDRFNVTNTTRIYDILTNTWTTGAPMPATLGLQATVLWNGVIYIVGGYNGAVETNTLYAYDIASDTWTTLAPMPQAVYAPGFGAINGKLYIAGGYVFGVLFNTLQIYDIATNTWDPPGANVPQAVGYCGSTVFNELLYLYGGIVQGSPRVLTNITQIYDPVSNTWSSGPNMNVAMGGSYGTAVGNGSIVAPGGFDVNVVGLNDNEQLINIPCLTSAFSRKSHGGAGTFDVPLPLTGNVGIECRSGGVTNDYQMIFDFANPVTVGSASVTSGTGSVSSFSVSGSEVTVNLTGVTNVQRITVTLFNVNDGTHMGNVPVSMGVLVGDVNGNAIVNASDVSLTKSEVGNSVTSSNFREDVNANGTISATDVALVKSDVGTALPP